MRIAVSYINALVTNTISDSHGGEPHINQQADVAMSDSVNPYSFHSAGDATTTYFVMHIGFCEREDTVSFVEL